MAEPHRVAGQRRAADLDYYHWSDPVPFRFDAAGRGFVRVEAPLA
jgi:hypothetical protein